MCSPGKLQPLSSRNLGSARAWEPGRRPLPSTPTPWSKRPEEHAAGGGGGRPRVGPVLGEKVQARGTLGGIKPSVPRNGAARTRRATAPYDVHH